MKTVKSDGDFRDAVICHANYARFGVDDRRILPNVQSRMCLWCKNGSGKVIISGRSFDCGAGDYFFLPWNHRIEYIPDDPHPFYLAGIHIVPRHDRKHPVEYDIPHDRTHKLYQCPWRSDAVLAPLKGIMHTHIGTDSPLFLLSESIVQIFRSPLEKDEDQIRHLARALIHELIRAFAKAKPDTAIPLHIKELAKYIDTNFTKPVTVEELVRHSERSRSGITDNFRKYYGKTPIQLVISKRIDKACELLATTSLPIGEIGRSSGIDDQFYFSKLFKKMTGHSPLAYRKQNQRF